MLKHRITTFAVLAAVTAVLAGCGGSQTPAKVRGKVTYKGSALPGGTVTFFTNAGQYSAPINPDGTYSAVDLPTGSATIVVETETLNPDPGGPASSDKKSVTKDQQRAKGQNMNLANRMKTESGGRAGVGNDGSTGGSPFSADLKADLGKRYQKIPSKYVDKRTSGLTIEISRGDNSKDIELTD